MLTQLKRLKLVVIELRPSRRRWLMHSMSSSREVKGAATD
jgi:hypothetical protein